MNYIQTCTKRTVNVRARLQDEGTKLEGRRTGVGGTKESDVVRITL